MKINGEKRVCLTQQLSECIQFLRVDREELKQKLKQRSWSNPAYWFGPSSLLRLLLRQPKTTCPRTAPLTVVWVSPHCLLIMTMLQNFVHWQSGKMRQAFPQLEFFSNDPSLCQVDRKNKNNEQTKAQPLKQDRMSNSYFSQT